MFFTSMIRLSTAESGCQENFWRSLRDHTKRPLRGQDVRQSGLSYHLAKTESRTIVSECFLEPHAWKYQARTYTWATNNDHFSPASDHHSAFSAETFSA